ncbi:MAG: D-alanyl-D-alanine carboxypeptidase/D-alanyl-D-alanine-endopeptidase [Geminocystis sp.]|nr:D-alanyl-D-alanine carboxypeptidase/D-alanyl-D-alanine-endopeptidase [Geminocystis sp.]MCS7147941.1 D-alanyl-D-alanine carboxypeptidase/D-alanyl-D-alanine-endopeptidase [Geminocystis sp.]MDW8116864.1 D-alanyl-D-alanine carboxypeptidase/D-alanyl-D-alanine-endopeptidase [Geminocystis sp.]
MLQVRILVTIFFSLGFSFGINLPLVASQIGRVCVQDLNREISSLLNTPERQKESWGVVVERLDNRQNLYQLNPNKYFIPASNVKLFTTAAILLKEGENFAIKTPIYLKTESEKTTLLIWGKGDPTISKLQLNIIANKLLQKGLKHLDELILVDDSNFAHNAVNHTWEFSDLFFSYSVPVNSLILGGNSVILTIKPSNPGEKVRIQWSDEIAGRQWQIINEGVTVKEGEEYTLDVHPFQLEPVLVIRGNLPVSQGEDNWFLSIPKPAEYFRDSLISILSAKGIIVDRVTINSTAQLDLKGYDLLLEFQSPPLKELIRKTNQDSNNLYGEVLFKYVAKNYKNPRDSLEEILEEIGINKENYQLKDGSGLSRQNLVTPKSIVDLLAAMANSKYGDLFRESLAVSGISGTLKNRLREPMAGKVVGKTGTLTGVAALSGYLHPQNYKDLVFSIIVNNSLEKSSDLRAIIDQIVVLLYKLEDCRSP